MIHLNELIEIDREHLKCDHQVLSENELVRSPDNVLLVFWVTIVKVLDKLGFNKTLLIKSLLVLENLQSYIFFLFVIVALEYDSETTFA